MIEKPVSKDSTAAITRKPMYEDQHESCSILMGRLRNSHDLCTLSAESQFTWLHRFYLVVDRVVEEHKVYKLYGGPHCFLISANVAERDDDHATTLYRFTRHLMASLKHVVLPGGSPIDVVLVAASGAMASGLLGTTSLTYQLVGQPAVEVTELAMCQPELQFMVTREFLERLEGGVAAASDLMRCGTFQLSGSGTEVEVYAPGEELAQGKKLQRAAEAACQQSPATKCSPAEQHDEPPLKPWKAELEGEDPEESPPSVLSYRKDPLLRYEDEAAEDLYVLQRTGVITQDAAWSLLGFFTCLIYLAGFTSEGRPKKLWQVSQVCLIPGIMMWLRRKHPEFYLRQRENVWVLHRVILVLVFSLADCPWMAGRSSGGGGTSLGWQLLAYGMGAVFQDVMGRRLRFHMQLASCVINHVVTLFLMAMHAPGTPQQQQLTPGFLSLHFLLTVFLPCLLSIAWDSRRRRAFQARQQVAAGKKAA